VTVRIVAALVLVVAGTAAAVAQLPQAPAAPRNQGRLFPPENLGLLEGPDRAVWQKPEEIMDALQIAYSSVVADIGPGAGWFTMRLAERVGPNGIVYARDGKNLHTVHYAYMYIYIFSEFLEK
jgi:hypothetical protein